MEGVMRTSTVTRRSWELRTPAVGADLRKLISVATSQWCVDHGKTTDVPDDVLTVTVTDKCVIVWYEVIEGDQTEDLARD